LERGAWRVEGGGWRVEGGGWRVEGGGCLDLVGGDELVHACDAEPVEHVGRELVEAHLRARGGGGGGVRVRLRLRLRLRVRLRQWLRVT